jgi:hypothetical protein
MNDSASTSSPRQQRQPGPSEESPLSNGGAQLLGTGNYQITFLAGGTGSSQPSSKDLLPTSESGRPFTVASPASSPTYHSPALWNIGSESTQGQYSGTTETLPSGSIVHRPTSEEFRPYGVGQVIPHSIPSVNVVCYIRL